MIRKSRQGLMLGAQLSRASFDRRTVRLGQMDCAHLNKFLLRQRAWGWSTQECFAPCKMFAGDGRFFCSLGSRIAVVNVKHRGSSGFRFELRRILSKKPRIDSCPKLAISVGDRIQSSPPGTPASCRWFAGFRACASRLNMPTELLVNFDAFWTRLSEDIAPARSSVFVQTFAFEGDSVGQKLSAALLSSGAPDKRVLADSFTRIVLSD